jgi:1-acyl-sn-glycerol-3-phosphate acyltransferase
MLRLIWVYSSAVFYVIFHIVPIRRRYKHPERYSIEERFKHIKKTCEIIVKRTGADLTVLGREHLIPDQPVLYIANHASMIDPYFVSVAVVHQLGAVIAGDDGYEKIPVLAPWFRSIGSVFVDRKNPREGIKAINQAIKNVKSGHSLILFPEGEITRFVAPDETVAPFHTGGLKIATKAGVPIIPIAISGTPKVFKARSVIGRIKKAKVTMTILEPYTKHINGSLPIGELAEELRQLIIEKVEEQNKMLEIK